MSSPRVRPIATRLAALACVGALVPSAFANCTDDQKFGTVGTQVGGTGGAPWDDKALASKGKITKIEVWGGTYVDAVRITYGTTAGPIHGGGGLMPGGAQNTILLASDEYIVMVDGQAGQYVDNLCFTKNNQQRTCTGGGGGATFQMSDGGKPLAYLSGRAGTYLDRVGASFTSPAEIDPASVHSDNAAMQAAVNAAQAHEVKQTIVNHTATEQHQKYDERQTVASSSSSNYSNSQTITQTHQVGGEFSWSPPSSTGGAGGKVSYSYTNTNSSSNSSGGSTSNSTSLTQGTTINVTIPPNSTIVAKTSWKDVSYSIPLYFDMVYYKDAAKTVPLCHESSVSTLRGVQTYDVKTTFNPGGKK